MAIAVFHIPGKSVAELQQQALITMNDYRVKVSVRNARLLKAVEHAGYKSLAAFGKAEGIAYSSLQRMAAMTDKPLLQDGTFSVNARRIMDGLCALPEDLWSDDQLYNCLSHNTFERDVSRMDLERISTNPMAELERQLDIDRDKQALMAAAEECLNERQKQALSLRNGLFGHGEHTYAEVGALMGVTSARARGIEMRAMEKMRDSEALKPVRDEWLKKYKRYKPPRSMMEKRKARAHEANQAILGIMRRLFFNKKKSSLDVLVKASSRNTWIRSR